MRRLRYGCSSSAGGARQVRSLYLLFTGTKVQKLTPRGRVRQRGGVRRWTGWSGCSSSLAQFTCFTGTEVQILTPEELCAVRRCEAVDGLERLLLLSRVPNSKLAIHNAGALLRVLALLVQMH
jgi:hypothetical protein